VCHLGLEARPRYDEHPPPFGCLLGRNGSSVTDILCQRSDALRLRIQPDSGRCYYFVTASTNKCLAGNNKSRTTGKATKRRMPRRALLRHANGKGKSTKR